MRRGWITSLAVLSCGFSASSSANLPGSAHRALDTALGGTDAVAIVLDGNSGRMIAAQRAIEGMRLGRAPGSVLKPFFVAAALQQGKVSAETTVLCRGNLRIAGRNLACTHPRSENVLDTERALAWSCNEWFAQLALRFTPEQAVDVLRAYGLGSGLTGDEASDTLRKPASQAELQLMVLGLDGVKVAPAQMARAWFRLAQQLDRYPAVMRGLEDSVTYGMAHYAATEGVKIAGKTGTASDTGEAWTHGWFAGIAQLEEEKVILAIYVPRGNGADAAELAHRFFAQWEKAAK